jgi:hypothetical protein
MNEVTVYWRDLASPSTLRSRFADRGVRPHAVHRRRFR